VEITSENRQVEVLDESSVSVGGRRVRSAWSPYGAVVDRRELRLIDASWSNSEIEEIASEAESLLQWQYERTYQVAFVTESGDFDVVEEFTAYSDEWANEYADLEYPDQEWFVLDAESGENING
jgi:hypothetical protein